MISFPNCKINLGLNVVEKRPDGYHNIEGVFYPVPLCDILELIEAPVQDMLSIQLSGSVDAGAPEKNLCIKAYHLLRKDFDLPPVSIYLHKAIPVGAGLGGGSSDGAQMLVMLNQLFQLGLGETKLRSYASVIGSDCSFFISNKPAYCYGRGELQKPLDYSLEGKFIIIVKPEIFISTTEAYAMIRPQKPAHNVQDIIKQPIEEWKKFLVNDFEESIFKKHPEIRKIKNSLYKNGAFYASMSGSGSSVYGIFDHPADLKNKFKHCFYWGGEL